MNRFAPLCLAIASLVAATVQAAANTSYGYAQVLRVEPVYELRTVQAVDPACLPPTGTPPPTNRDCKPHSVAVRRIVAFDVEYSYKGDTYMSRLKQDPGSRLRVRVTVEPDDDRAPASVAPSETR